MAKAARLYHHSGLRQMEIAARLQISQAKVSRLLGQAEAAGIVKTVVVPVAGLNSEIEEQVEDRYGVGEVHAVDTVGVSQNDVSAELGAAAAGIFSAMAVDVPLLGVTSWSHTLRHLIDALRPVRTGTATVVELLGDLGPPLRQHEAARSTQRLATLVGAEAMFLNVPGVVSSPGVRAELLAHDTYAQQALRLHDTLDLALVSVGSGAVVPPLLAGGELFSEDDLRAASAAGAVGQVCLRFLDADGAPVATALDELVIGVGLEQLRAAKRRWVVAGGPSKSAMIRAMLRGGWVDTLVTDTATALWLLSDGTKPQ